MNQSFYMHPRYIEFLAFLESVQTDARINPNALNLAFDVWLSNQLNVELINENTILRAKADVFLKSCKAYEESNETLKTRCIAGAYKMIDSFFIILCLHL